MLILWMLLLLGACLLLWKGAEWVIDSSAGLASKLGIPEFIVGLTLVAFGTSLPEMVVNLLAVYHHKTDIVMGNILGSNIANILLVLGISSVLYPIAFDRTATKRELPISLLITILLGVFLYAPQGPLILSSFEGSFLLICFLLFILGLGIILKKTDQDAATHPPVPSSTARLGGQFVIGLAALILGGRLIITSAVNLATVFGVSEAFISLFLVAFGTSLPELITCIVAALRKQPSLLIGNILGSNIFNIALILGICSLIQPLSVNGLFWTDYLITLIATIGLSLILTLPKWGVINRWKGSVFFVSYLVYIVFISLRG